MEDVQLEAVMGLIMNSGEAKSLSMEAIAAAKSGNFDLADEKLSLAQEALLTAHHSQTALLTQEARGEEVPLTLLAVHSQDHLMTSITFLDLAREIVDLYRSR